MSKKKKPYKFEISRAQFEKIRKMSHTELDQYIKGLTGSVEKRSYDIGFEAGRKVAENVITDMQQKSTTADSFLERVSHVSGIGPKLMERIREEFSDEG